MKSLDGEERNDSPSGVLGLFQALVVAIWCTGCAVDNTQNSLFERVSSKRSGVLFSNTVTSTDSLNIYSYNNFYAGGGVALADFDGDGQLDIYLVSNQNSNRLYLNRGDFVFEDMTETSGTGGRFPWSTGASVADINADGLPDLYVTNAGAFQRAFRANELFVNNGDGTFTERAGEYGLADEGYSVHAVFFDYDQDERLDIYIVNNFPARPIAAYDLAGMDRNRPNFEGGDRLYRNTGKSFVDVTETAGIFSSEAGFALGASAGDLNRDGCMDLYVSNDFFERDYLYINQCNGTFRESLESILPSTSTTSMGGDIADLDNDGAPEIFISDMLPATEGRIKRVARFAEWEKYREEIELGYHRKFLRNTLHYNNADGTFSEIGRYSGVEATDWSWGGLLADFNLDGLRDIFVPNGFYKDVTDKDLLMTSARLASTGLGQADYIRQVVDMMPVTPISNHAFENLGDLRFEDRASDWGLDTPGFSSGAAYGDLDGDGDLDLVVNNVNMEAYVYRNHTSEQYPDRSWLQIELKGENTNSQGVGAQIRAVHHRRQWYAEQMLQRGFQSSMDPVIHLGLGAGVDVVDTLHIQWPDGRVTIQTQVFTRQQVTLHQEQAFWPDTVPAKASFASPRDANSLRNIPFMEDVTEKRGLDWTHVEFPHNDFQHSPLLFHMRSTEGPPLCSADINGDGRDELYAGGGRGQPGVLFTQDSAGNFRKTLQPALERDQEAEDVDCVWADVDGDGGLELYVASGSSEFPSGQPVLADRLYALNEEAILVPFEHELPDHSYKNQPTGAVRAADVDQDGDSDLLVGIRQGAVYGEPAGGILLENDGAGRFRDATDHLIPGIRESELKSAGITDAAWGDLNRDGYPDLVVAGEWMPLTVFLNRNGILVRIEPDRAGLAGTSGWWQSVALADLDDDGALDVIAGNHGLNTRFKAEPHQPLGMWVHDFDRDGRSDQIITGYDGNGGPWPFALREQLLLHFGLAPYIARSDLPGGQAELQWILQKFPHLTPLTDSFESYAEKTVHDLFGTALNDAMHYAAERLETVVLWNQQDDSFSMEILPFRSQLTPMYTILAEDIDGDSIPEILMGGNLYAASPQAGRYDAGYGVVLRRDSTKHFTEMSAADSGLNREGEIRAFQVVHSGEERLIAVSYSGGSLRLLRPTHRDL